MKPTMIVMLVVQCLLIALLIFVPAGTLLWPAGWIFLLMLYAFTIAVLRLSRGENSGLLEERSKVTRAGQKGWDKVFTYVFGLLFLAWLVVMSLDAARFQWSQVPLYLQIAGAIGAGLGLRIMYLAFRENAYLSNVVRIQDDRGQVVVMTGPYARVRHPLYAGAWILFPCAALLLGSWVGFGLAWLLNFMFAVRTVKEEQVLHQELAGYTDYTEVVRYRLIPYVW